jgi:Ca2+-binding RTX toxin-like protein
VYNSATNLASSGPTYLEEAAMFRRLDYGRLGILAVLSVTGVLVAAPAAHGAAISARAAGPIGTLNFDAGNDTVTVSNAGGQLSHGLTGATTTPGEAFNSALDWDTSVAGDQTLPANGTSEIVLNGGDGLDSFTAPQGVGELLRATLNGDGGNDLLTGSRAADDLRGGAGNDRVVGFAGNDDMEGGDGNDTLVWNNGDGSDIMDGDAGNDGVEVNGAATAGDAFLVQPGPVAGRVRFDRTNLGPFNLDILAERLEVNGNGGDDSMSTTGALSALILMTLSGGTGIDTITGGDGPDLILGGEEADILAGGAADDRVVGDRGGDAMNGGDGDDTLVWNNGDGSDVMDGAEGRDAIEINGAPGGADTFTVEPNGARIKFDRTNLGPFTLDIGTSELMDLNSLAGNDAITVGEVGAFHVVADGGSGNDALDGAGGAQTFIGGPGNDAITPGAGSDVASGDQGDDTIVVRDGFADFTRCGEGSDQVTADGTALDGGMEGCETISRTPDPATQPVTIGSATVKIKNRKGKVTVACPATSASDCEGKLTVLTAKPVKIGDVKAVIQLATATFDVAPGSSDKVRIKVPKGAEEFANQKGKLSARVNATTGPSPVSASSSQKLKLDFGRPESKHR